MTPEIIFNPRTSVEDTVALVVDRNHQRFGQIASVTLHDWLEYGNYFLHFVDGEEAVSDGLMKGDPPSPVRIFYRKKEDIGLFYDIQHAGPDEFKQIYEALGVGNLDSLREKYRSLFGEELQ